MRPDDPEREPTHRQVAATRLGEGAGRTLDSVVAEAPVALVFNGLSHAVMLATPGDLEAFGLGFALAEGVIEAASECFDLEVSAASRGWVVEMRIPEPRFRALKSRRRAMEGRSGCGLCGVDSLDALALDPPRVPPLGFELDAAVLQRAGEALRGRQPLFDRTGGLHAAAWADAQGTLHEVLEDVGRHNALDKLIGALARRGVVGAGPARRVDAVPGFVLMSSRIGFELVHKCAQAGVSALVAVSAPSSMAVEAAQRAGLLLVGFSRGASAVRYAP